MTKQEEIKKGLEEEYRNSNRCDDETFCIRHKDCCECDAEIALNYLHSKWVVIENPDEDGNVWIEPLIEEKE